jgi:hypothetical protein
MKISLAMRESHSREIGGRSMYSRREAAEQ